MKKGVINIVIVIFLIIFAASGTYGLKNRGQGCTNSEECLSRICSGGEIGGAGGSCWNCDATNACQRGDQCIGEICKGGISRPCYENVQCITEFCKKVPATAISGTCANCRTTAECGTGMACAPATGRCLKNVYQPCATGLECLSGFCSSRGGDLGMLCTACRSDSDCGLGKTCAAGGICQASSGAAPAGATCSANAQCASGYCDMLGKVCAAPPSALDRLVAEINALIASMKARARFAGMVLT